MNQRDFLSLFDFTDRTILVTGGAGALGIEISRMLVECNANVVILSRNAERGKKSILEINKAINGNVPAIYLHGDVLNIATLHQANETICSQFGWVDILINAAGGNHPQAITSSNLTLFDLPLDSLRYISDLNLLGTILP
jgi:NAD(P)-dependent dehydrogenase (short-subunit alcohol dehydrogenase family)